MALVGTKHPELLKQISKLSEKWEKRTKGMTSARPKDGTFDVTVCEDMERRIRDHKIKDKSKKWGSNI